MADEGKKPVKIEDVITREERDEPAKVITVRMPASLHKRLLEKCEVDNISMNLFCVQLLKCECPCEQPTPPVQAGPTQSS